jgi:hypothetical protein
VWLRRVCKLAEGKFERIVVALLALMYLEITSQFSVVRKGLAELTMNTEFSAMEIGKLLNDQRIDDYIPRTTKSIKHCKTPNFIASF